MVQSAACKLRSTYDGEIPTSQVHTSLCEALAADRAAKNVGAFIQKSALQNFRNAILKTAKSER